MLRIKTISIVLNSKIFAIYQFAETPHTIISEKKQIVALLRMPVLFRPDAAQSGYPTAIRPVGVLLRRWSIRSMTYSLKCQEKRWP